MYVSANINVEDPKETKNEQVEEEKKSRIFNEYVTHVKLFIWAFLGPSSFWTGQRCQLVSKIQYNTYK